MKIIWTQHGNIVNHDSSNAIFVILHKSGGVDSPNASKMWLETPSQADIYTESENETDIIESLIKYLERKNINLDKLYVERAY